MFVSKKLLANINPNFATITNSNLVSALNAIGIEVEQIIENKISNDLVLGRLINFRKHENSDRLNICDVVVNNKKYEIVCGAKNLKPNQWVVVALDGATIKNDWQIEKRVIRGVESNGMLCGLDEIMIVNNEFVSNNDKDTIIQIPYECQINPITFFDDFNFNDTIFEISIPSNRPELNGIYYLAYELNLQFNFAVEKINVKHHLKKNTNIKVEIDKAISTIKYSMFEMQVKNDPLTKWRTKMLLVNNHVFDNDNYIKNLCSYFSLLFAQPILPINRNNILDTLFVTTLKEDTNFIAENNQEYLLKTGTIVTINANHEIISVTGRYVSNKYCISDDDDSNQKLCFEAINFGGSIAKHQNHLNNFNDERAKFYTKTISSVLIPMLLNYFNKHQTKFGIEGMSTFYLFTPPKSPIFKIRYKSLVKLIGVNLHKYVIARILHKIGILYIGQIIKIPPYRLDLCNIADIAEEIIKNIDINQLVPLPIKSEISNFKTQDSFNQYAQLINCLVNHGFYEVKTYNLTDENKAKMFNWFSDENSQLINIQNFASTNRSVLRTNVIGQMLEILKTNMQNNNLLENIFEIQKIQISKNKTIDVLGCIINVPFYNQPLNKNVINADSYNTTALINAIFQIYNVNLTTKYNQDKFNELEKNNNTFYYYKNNFVGVVGNLNQQLLISKYKIKHPTICICLNLTQLSEVPKTQFAFREKSDFNPIYKTITFTNNNKLYLDNVIPTVMQVPNITDAYISDVFEKNGQMSYTISITIQPTTHNLTNTEINDIYWQVINNLRKLQLTIKEG